jgi:hypothetical protein
MGNEESLDGGEVGGRVCSGLKKVNGTRRGDSDMAFSVEEGEGEQGVVIVRQKDQSGIVTEIFFEEKCVGEVQLERSNDIVNLSQIDMSSWKVRIAGGVDPAILSCLSVILRNLKLIRDTDPAHSSLSSWNSSHVERVGCTQYTVPY